MSVNGGSVSPGVHVPVKNVRLTVLLATTVGALSACVVRLVESVQAERRRLFWATAPRIHQLLPAGRLLTNCGFVVLPWRLGLQPLEAEDGALLEPMICATQPSFA